MGPRFAYLFIHASSYPHEFYNGVVKFDMWRKIPLAVLRFSGVSSGFTFIPSEDGVEDGYLAGYTYELKKQITRLEIIDTELMEDSMKIIMPQRVPFGTEMHFIPIQN